MCVLIAIVTGILSLANYAWQTSGSASQVQSLILQFILAAVTLIALFGYSGKRTRKNYEIGKPRIFTLRFAIIFVSAMGNVMVLGVLILFNLNVIQSL